MGGAPRSSEVAAGTADRGHLSRADTPLIQGGVPGAAARGRLAQAGTLHGPHGDSLEAEDATLIASTITAIKGYPGQVAASSCPHTLESFSSIALKQPPASSGSQLHSLRLGLIGGPYGSSAANPLGGLSVLVRRALGFARSSSLTGLWVLHALSPTTWASDDGQWMADACACLITRNMVIEEIRQKQHITCGPIWLRAKPTAA